MNRRKFMTGVAAAAVSPILPRPAVAVVWGWGIGKECDCSSFLVSYIDPEVLKVVFDDKLAIERASS